MLCSPAVVCSVPRCLDAGAWMAVDYTYLGILDLGRVNRTLLYYRQYISVL